MKQIAYRAACLLCDVALNIGIFGTITTSSSDPFESSSLKMNVFRWLKLIVPLSLWTIFTFSHVSLQWNWRKTTSDIIDLVIAFNFTTFSDWKRKKNTHKTIFCDLFYAFKNEWINNNICIFLDSPIKVRFLRSNKKFLINYTKWNCYEAHTHTYTPSHTKLKPHRWKKIRSNINSFISLIKFFSVRL